MRRYRECELRVLPLGDPTPTRLALESGATSSPTPKSAKILLHPIYDVPGSTAHLSIRQGGVSGYVKVPGDTTYHIEPARNHFKNAKFHTIIYPESKMNLDPFKDQRNHSCGYDAMLNKMKATYQTLIKEHPGQQQVKKPPNKYTDPSSTRQRRQVNVQNLLDPTRSTCTLAMRADQLLYNHVLDKYSDTPDLSKEQQAREELLAFFASHVTALNEIFQDTTLAESTDPSQVFRGVRFQIQKTVIITECNTPPNNWDSGYCTNNVDISNYLELTALKDLSEFCLAYTFTFRDFTQGRVGLAWVANPGSSRGGVCDQFGKIQDSSGDVFDKSLNTGIVSLLNFGRELSTRVSQLVFAHEVGHNFGAEHDFSNECAPYGTNLPTASDGNYIMFYSTTQGNLPNNDAFSSCSREYMFRVLKSMQDGVRTDCFQASDSAFCGNTVVEVGEECDCGYEEDCATLDECCVPRSLDGTTGCTLRASAVCSPLDGPCCKSNCEYFGTDRRCGIPTDCQEASFCLGNNASCPQPRYKTNYQTYCSDYTSVCENGECTGSLCRKIGWLECFKTSADGVSREEMCYLSCRQNETSECISSNDADKMLANTVFKDLVDEIKANTNDLSIGGVLRPPSSSCDNLRGYCDSLGVCRNVDNESPFGQLADLLFDSDSWDDIQDWMKDYWWVMALAVLGFVLLLVVFIKVCSYNTPSQDPNKERLIRQTEVTDDRMRAGQMRAQPYKMPGVYSVEVPKQGRKYVSYGHGQSQGHENRAFQSSHGMVTSGGQYDRIAGPNRWNI